MIPIYEPKPLGALGHDGDELRIGWASWDRREKSIKYCYLATNRRIARTSPEVPMWILVEMVKYALEKNELSVEQCKELQDALVQRR